MTIKRKLIPNGSIRSLISDEVNEENRTIELTFSTGAKGLRHGWDGPYYEELSMDPNHVDLSRLQSGAPLLAAHDSFSLDAVIGVVERAWLEGNEGKALVRFSADPEADKVFRKVKEKVLRNVSIGYQVRKYADVTQKEESIPTYRAIDYSIMEISIVSIPFDSAAQIRTNQELTEVELIPNPENEITNEPVTEAAPTIPQEENRSMTEAEKLALEQAAKKQAALEERQRANEIRSAVRLAKLEESYADELIAQEITADQARKLVLEKKAAQEPAPVINITRVEIGTDERDKKRDAMIDAVLHRTDAKAFQPKQGNPFVYQSMLRMMEAFVPRNVGESDASYATRAMSSSDLPYILANVAEKSAQSKYSLQPNTWSRWAKRETLRNFKTHDKVRSGDFASLLEMKEGSEVKLGSFGEEREQVALKSYGIKMAFTRRMMINDDLGELAKVTSQAGASASLLENQLVYGQLTSNPTMGDTVALFHADHGNLGTGAALTDASIGEAFKLMRQQESVDGRHKLNLTPKYLICGPENEVAAKKYLAQITPAQSSNVNIFSNSLELIVDAEIDTNDYFFAADASLCPTVVLYNLEGQSGPRVESRTNFDTSSVEIKCEHDAVAKAADWRGLVKNANAS